MMRATPALAMRAAMKNQGKLAPHRCEQWPAWFKTQCPNPAAREMPRRWPDRSVSRYQLCTKHAVEMTERRR